MRSDIAVCVESLSKRYKVGRSQKRHNTLKDAIAEAVRAPFHRKCYVREEECVWALREVSFNLQYGDVLGIIGRNGAGKSTLLKILSRITEPTEGRALIRGRVGSLLEVGTGFHPELTGRENIFLNGAILGMKRAEIEHNFDEIVAFAELGKFIDTPVKRYSSGMYVRLAFAVAAHLNPEILMVDEVLAVGDAAFQKRCLGKMSSVAAEGRTVLFVSHNMGAIRSLTQQCIYLDQGCIRGLGVTEEIVRQYLDDVLDVDKTDMARPPLDRYHRDTVVQSPVRLSRVWVNQADEQIPTIELGQGFDIFVQIETDIEVRGAHVGLGIKRRNGTSVMVMLSVDYGFRLSLPPGSHIVRCRVADLPLAPGDYLVDVGINQSEGRRSWDVILDYPLLRVEDRSGRIMHWTERPWGAVHWEDVAWSISS